jgi:hypothetical protein
MSRSGYSDDCENIWLWRNSVDRALNGKRGQAFLRELLDTLDAMPKKELIEGELVTEDGEVCALGSVFKARNINVVQIPEYYDNRNAGKALGIAYSMVAEIAYMNDNESQYDETPAQRWVRMRAWVVGQIKTVQY